MCNSVPRTVYALRINASDVWVDKRLDLVDRAWHLVDVLALDMRRLEHGIRHLLRLFIDAFSPFDEPTADRKAHDEVVMAVFTCSWLVSVPHERL